MSRITSIVSTALVQNVLEECSTIVKGINGSYKILYTWEGIIGSCHSGPQTDFNRGGSYARRADAGYGFGEGQWFPCPPVGLGSAVNSPAGFGAELWPPKVFITFSNQDVLSWQYNLCLPSKSVSLLADPFCHGVVHGNPLNMPCLRARIALCMNGFGFKFSR